MATKVKGIDFSLSAKDRTAQAFDRVKKNVGGITDKIRKMRAVVATTVAGVVAGFGAMVTAAARAGDQFDKMSLRLGVSAKALSEYSHIAELAGVNIQTLTMGWQRMTRRIAEAAVGTGEARSALKEMNLSAQDLVQLAPDKQFEIIAQALSEVGTQADRVRLAMKLFDSEGVALVQIVGQGSDAIQKMKQDAEDLGLVMTNAQAKIGADMVDAVTRLKASFTGLGRTLLEYLGPGLTKVINWLADLGASMRRNFVDNITTIGRDFRLVMADIMDGLGDVAAFMADAPSWLGGNQFAEWAVQARGFATELRLLRVDVVEPTSASMGELATQIGDYVEVTNKATKATRELYDSHVKERQEFQTRLKDWSIIMEKQWDWFDKTKDESDKVSDAARQLGLTFESAFESAIVEGKGLQDVLKGILQDITRIAVRKAITEPMAAFITQSLSTAAPLMFAGGGVTSGGRSRALPFAARGGTYNRPTIISEYGQPEAAVPLPDGRSIPVTLRGGGGGASVNINVHATVAANGGDPVQNQDLAERSGRELARALKGEIREEIRMQLRPGGSLNQQGTTRQGF